MGLTLILGSKNYSSWSMRAWMLLRFVGAAFEERLAQIYTAGSRDEVKALGGADRSRSSSEGWRDDNMGHAGDY